jgi:hypothetical protein
MAKISKKEKSLAGKTLGKKSAIKTEKSLAGEVLRQIKRKGGRK